MAALSFGLPDTERASPKPLHHAAMDTPDLPTDQEIEERLRELLAEMQALLQKYGHTVGLVPEPPKPEVVPVKLSKRMREYMGLMCQGLSIKEICHIMHVCPSTLRIWRNRIFERYGIRGRVLLALWARENGLG